MTSTLRIGEPVRVGDWWLTADNMANPTRAILGRCLTPGKRFTEPFERVVDVPYTSVIGELKAPLVDAGVPAGQAVQLIVQLDMRLRSPKAKTADLGYRPISGSTE